MFNSRCLRRPKRVVAALAAGAWLMALGWAPNAPAYMNFEDGCKGCHNLFNGAGAVHGTHAGPAGGCSVCHAGDPAGFGNPPLANCTVCHGRPGEGGAGLRQHHRTAGTSACSGCHSNPEATAPESTMPSAYANAGLNPCDGSEEQFGSRTVSLDNDGDGLTDGADPDCGPPANTAPVANNDSATTPQNTMVNIDVLGNDSDADGDTLTINSFDANSANGGSVACAPNAPCTYIPAGGFTGTDSFTYANSDGTDVSNRAMVSIAVTPVVANTPPVCNGIQPTSGQEGAAMSFSATVNEADGDPISYAWDFGDGSGSAMQNPLYTYAAQGNYTVTLTVSDNEGSNSCTAQVSISPVSRGQPPACGSIAPTSGQAGQPLAFSASVMEGDGDMVSYDWRFGDGGSSTQMSPSHSYSASGSYTVSLTVSDVDGAGSCSAAVNVTGGGAGANNSGCRTIDGGTSGRRGNDDGTGMTCADATRNGLHTWPGGSNAYENHPDYVEGGRGRVNECSGCHNLNGVGYTASPVPDFAPGCLSCHGSEWGGSTGERQLSPGVQAHAALGLDWTNPVRQHRDVAERSVSQCTACHSLSAGGKANANSLSAPGCYTCHGQEWSGGDTGGGGDTGSGGDGGFNPPPDHTDSEDGFLHRPGKDNPFTNGCTACHGSNLTGGIAPSCYTCHGQEWNGGDAGGGGDGGFNPPPDHTDSEDGFLHRPGKDNPFTNGCTACHGSNLTGGIAPSCYTCHGQEWNGGGSSGGSGDYDRRPDRDGRGSDRDRDGRDGDRRRRSSRRD